LKQSSHDSARIEVILHQQHTTGGNRSVRRRGRCSRGNGWLHSIQFHVERRSTTNTRTAGTDATAVHINQRLGNRQPQAQPPHPARLLVLLKRVEKPFL